jgi:hypothetical protein
VVGAGLAVGVAVGFTVALALADGVAEGEPLGLALAVGVGVGVLPPAPTLAPLAGGVTLPPPPPPLHATNVAKVRSASAPRRAKNGNVIQSS